MRNAPDVSSQSTPDKRGDQAAERLSDNSLAENSQEDLDARLDHAIEENFPTSDPISVVVPEKAVPEVPREVAATSSVLSRESQDQAEQSSADELLDDVWETLQDVARTAFGAAREAYRETQDYVRKTGEWYPEAEQHYRAGQRAQSTIGIRFTS